MSARLRMTVAEFLDWPGDGRAKRYQLIDGEVRAMALASPAHGMIGATLARLIGNRLEQTKSPCLVVIAPGVVPRLRSDINFRVPDLGVTCGEIKAGELMLPDPVLLIEILSPSNEADTRANVWAYATIPSVREILIVHSTQIAAELLRRQPNDASGVPSRAGNWPETPEEIGPNGVLRLETIDLTCPISALYVGAHLA